jgi:nickel/cobalt exporter
MTETVPLGWYYLPVAFALGALHALEPGHGKSLASAYLVAGRHTRADAVVLGVATTLSHTSVVLLLAGASLGLKGLLPQGRLEALVRDVGAWALLLLGAWTAVRAGRDLSHGHGHGHGHSHGNAHAQEPAGQHRGFWGVVLIGLSNGALPCPGALAALLVALSMGRVVLGLTTVVTYSLGLAAALAAMGVLVVEASRRARVWFPSERALLWLPLASGLLVLGTGAWLLAAA